MKTFSITDVGTRREMNQDYFFSSETKVGPLPNLFIVADGMGGHKAGDYASRYTIERIVASVSRCKKKEPILVFREAIQKANELLLSDAKEDAEKTGMGTTLVIATIIDDKMCVANIGDSRLYIIGSEITQVTKDHSLVEEMVRMGKLDEELARKHPDKNIITRAVGATDELEADFFEITLEQTDYVLLCSDGLTNMVKDETIKDIVLDNTTLEEKATNLVKLANQNGGSDNITVMIIEPFSGEVRTC